MDRLQPGFLYDVGTTLGVLLLAEGWAEPVINEEPALVVPLSETESSVEVAAKVPSNLIREKYPRYTNAGVAVDFPRRRRPST